MADSQPWCATATDVNGHMVTNDWGYCTAECPVMPHTHCRTVQGGPIEGAFCRFPFRYKDVEYNMCTRVDHYLTPDAVEAGVNSTQGWCATKVDTHDDYIPHNWGICQPECKPPVSKCNKEFYYFRLKVCILWRFKILDLCSFIMKIENI